MSSTRLICFLSALCISILPQNVESRLYAQEIIGGEIAREGQFPYQVFIYSLNRTDQAQCGGAIISKYHVLTAAHCVIDYYGFFELPLYVKVGVINGKQISHGYKVKKIYVPWKHKPSDPEGNFDPTYDLAVMKLSRSLDLSPRSKIRAVNLPKKQKANETAMRYSLYEGHKAILTGYGWNIMDKVTELEEIGSTDNQLRYAEVKVLSPEKCGKHTKASVICGQITRRENMQRGACSGDSGSPLVIKNTIIGVLSASPTGCQERQNPAKYVRVSKLMRFIQNAMEGKNESLARVAELKDGQYMMTADSQNSKLAKEHWKPEEL